MYILFFALTIIMPTHNPVPTVSVKPNCYKNSLCQPAKYYTPSRASVEEFKLIDGGKSYVWGGYEIVPDPSGIGDLQGSESIWQKAQNCTNDRYICIKSTRWIFAVPKHSFHEKEKFFADGSLITVERCLKFWHSKCVIALFRSDCQAVENYTDCAPTRDHIRATNSGPIIYYIYNKSHGVTSYGTVTRYAKDFTEAMHFSSQYILYGGKGILYDGSENQKSGK